MEPTLEGAVMRRGRWNPGGRTLELLLGLPGGETDLLLRYRGVTLLEPALPRVAQLVEDISLRIAGATRDAGLHTLTFSSGDRLQVRCTDHSVSPAVPCSPGYADLEPRFIILSC